ncbi:MAG: cyclic pyranopterin monophosphate synthase MoaC [Gemmatimonadaceae bacterium]
MKDLTHTDAAGQARMVDVGAKEETSRNARAAGAIKMSPETLRAIEQNAIAKGDVIATARIAGIMAAKRTAELIPLCHPLSLTDAGVDVAYDQELPGLRVNAWASTRAPTGVEMEALTAVTVTLLTIYDMAKAIDRGMEISEIRLLEKRGGKGGAWIRAGANASEGGQTQ